MEIIYIQKTDRQLNFQILLPKLALLAIIVTHMLIMLFFFGKGWRINASSLVLSCMTIDIVENNWQFHGLFGVVQFHRYVVLMWWRSYRKVGAKPLAVQSSTSDISPTVLAHLKQLQHCSKIWDIFWVFFSPEKSTHGRGWNQRVWSSTS